MASSSRSCADRDDSSQILWEEGDSVFSRVWRQDADGDRTSVLTMLPATDDPAQASFDRLNHAYALRDELESAWALRPLALERENGRAMLVLEDPGGEPVARQLGAPMEAGRFLRLAIGAAAALGKVHQHGLVHKDMKPANILVDCADGRVRLTGFGLASRLPRERQAPDPPEFIAGTLAYMAPEQTGRMNRSIDARSDLYALGVTFYHMVTGSLPFAAADPMEWVHCHTARRPTPPCERLQTVPAPVSGIIMKLLAKTAEDRYQTAAGLERDLRRCLAGWELQGCIDDFPLGQQDTPDWLLVPEKLYGREREVDTLLAAFDRIVRTGTPELVLVSGYAGIGKSSVVHELHKALVPPRGIFVAGKFDQYKRDIPYATLAQAFLGLVRLLLAKSDAELRSWRDELLEALGPNGQLLVDLIPELKLIIGDQPPVPELSPRDAQRRFQLVFRRFIGVFARLDHPLALFLDDLQWLDPATLDVLEDLLTQQDVHYLLLIGAYRDNEAGPGHPLARKLESIRAAGANIERISLVPLTNEHLQQLIADSLRCDLKRATPLAELVHEKTAGNPFFVIQFLYTLVQEELLAFDHDTAGWSWDLGRIHAKGYTDNVVDLMVGRLHRLPPTTRGALRQLACLGNSAAIDTLTMVLRTDETQVHDDLWEAVLQELVLLLGDTWKFVHDRVQEAAYSLIPEAARAAEHLRIGRLMLAHAKPGQREEEIFEIVSQLNRGAALVTEIAEREQLAELNLIAGQRAKASTAYASALRFLTTGAALLTEDCWQRRHDLAFALELNRAECEFLTGALSEADERLAALRARATTTIEQATIACLRTDLYMTLDQTNRAIAVGLDYLRLLGIDWSPHPTDEEARAEYERLWSQIGDRTIEELIDLPRMSDPASLATLDVLNMLGVAAFFTDLNLHSLAPCRIINLSLEHGHCDTSCVAYAQIGLIAGSRFNDFQAACRFGRLGYDLVEQRGLTRFQARTYNNVGVHIFPWTEHFKAARDVLRRSFEIASRIGDLTFVGYSAGNLITNLLAVGDPLAEVEREAERNLAFTRQVRFGFAADIIAAQLGLIRTLRGSTPRFGFLEEEGFNERQLEERFAGSPDLEFAKCWYLIRKLQSRFLAGDYAAAVEAAEIAQQQWWTSLTTLETAEFHLYGALAHAAFHDLALPGQRHSHLTALAAHHRRLAIWAERCPQNFGNRAALVGAELARIEGRVLDAEELYEQAIRAARTNGFVHNEALAYELAARFYAARGFDRFARVYLQSARDGYLRWGATGKVRQLEALYPDLREGERAPGLASTIGTTAERLDLATVLKVSQTVSSEIVLERLLVTLMRAAIEHAGAERGVLIVPVGSEHRVAVEAAIGGDSVDVRVRNEPMEAAALSESIVHYVLRTREPLLLGDASAENPFAADTYFRRHRARSVLCLPLINQTKIIGVLYLENNLAPHVFTSARISVLKLLASQAAIALENTRLYGDLAEREAKIRRLVDANIIGIFFWQFDGQILEANDAFLHMVGYDREDLAARRLRWTDLTPPEWHDLDATLLQVCGEIGHLQPFEKEYYRRDGSRLPVLMGVATFEEGRNQGVAFVVDMTERKRAEAEAQENERRYREVLTELAHANRVATMGLLTASIAHEVNQPLAATVSNAQAARRWLGHQPPNVQEVEQALDRIVRDGDRAAEVISRMRALIKRGPSRTEYLELNEAIREVADLTHGEALKQGVELRMQPAAALPLIGGDRVQLQQVVLNLVMNAVQALGGVSEGVREILISTGQSEPGFVNIAVMDSGPGLDPASLARVFEPFYTTKPGGLGMGLSICRSIIEAHGGELWAEANEPRGAVFRFTLPAQPDPAS